MSTDLHSRLLSEIEQLRRNIFDQSIMLDRLDIAVVMIIQELRDHNGPRFPPVED